MKKQNKKEAEKPKKEEKPQLSGIKPIALQYVRFDIVGESTYIPGRPPLYLADHMKAMMDRRIGEKRPVIPRLTHEEEAQASIYFTGDKKTPYGIPAACFHGSMMQAAREIMHLPVDNLRLFRVIGSLLPMECEDFDLCSKDVVFRGKKKNGVYVTHYPVTVYRAHFNAPWFVRLNIVFKPDVIPLDTLGQLVLTAGQFVGVGQGRPGLGGHENCGTYRIKGVEEKESPQAA